MVRQLVIKANEIYQRILSNEFTEDDIKLYFDTVKAIDKELENDTI